MLQRDTKIQTMSKERLSTNKRDAKWLQRNKNNYKETNKIITQKHKTTTEKQIRRGVKL